MRSTMPTASPHMYTRTYTRLQVLIILFGVIITCLFQAANRVSWDNQTYSYHIRLLVCNPFVLLTFIVAVVWTWRIVYPDDATRIDMKRKVLLCFVPLLLGLIVRDLTWSDDEYTSIASKVGYAGYSFLHWLMMFVIIPWIYFKSVRTNRRTRYLQKMFVFAFVIPAVAHIIIVFASFGNTKIIPISLVITLLCWVILMLMDKKEVKSPKKDFGCVLLLSYFVISAAVAFGGAAVAIFEAIDESQHPSLKFLVCLFALFPLLLIVFDLFVFINACVIMIYYNADVLCVGCVDGLLVCSLASNILACDWWRIQLKQRRFVLYSLFQSNYSMIYSPIYCSSLWSRSVHCLLE